LVSDYGFAPEIDEPTAKEVLYQAKEFVRKIRDYLVSEGHMR